MADDFVIDGIDVQNDLSLVMNVQILKRDLEEMSPVYFLKKRQ